jgi:hypothetical protein
VDILTSRKAADRLGVNVQKFHRLVARHNIKPVGEVPGIRGAKFWHALDIDRLAANTEAERAAS